MSTELRARLDRTAQRLEELDRSLDLESIRLVSSSVHTSVNWDELDFSETDWDVSHKIKRSDSEALVLQISIELSALAAPPREHEHLFDLTAVYEVHYSRPPGGIVSEYVSRIEGREVSSEFEALPPVPEGLALRYSQSYGLVVVSPRFRSLLERVGIELNFGYIPFGGWDRSPLRYVEILNEMTIASHSTPASEPIPDATAEQRAESKSRAKKAPTKKAPARKTATKKTTSRTTS
jgi:hypothetical protein